MKLNRSGRGCIWGGLEGNSDENLEELRASHSDYRHPCFLRQLYDSNVLYGIDYRRKDLRFPAVGTHESEPTPTGVELNQEFFFGHHVRMRPLKVSVDEHRAARVENRERGLIRRFEDPGLPHGVNHRRKILRLVAVLASESEPSLICIAVNARPPREREKPLEHHAVPLGSCSAGYAGLAAKRLVSVVHLPLALTTTPTRANPKSHVLGSGTGVITTDPSEAVTSS